MVIWHLDSNLFHLGEDETNILNVPVISLSCQKAGFESKLGEVRGLLEEYTKPYKVAGGWRIEKEIVQGEENEKSGQ